MKVKIFHIGIDYLRFNLCREMPLDDIEPLFEGFSDNSDQKFEQHFLGHTFNLTFRGDKQKQIIDFYHGPYHVFCLVKYLENSISYTVPYSFTFYGTYFSVHEIQNCLLTFLERNHLFMTVSRIDIAVDTNVTTETLWQWKRTQFKADRVYRKNGHTETFYLGEKKNNKKFFIRVYDKKIDSLAKGKFTLFHHYLEEEVVTRIEAQINILTAKNLQITPAAILEYSKANIEGDDLRLAVIEHWFSALCMNEQGTFFYSLRGVCFTKADHLMPTKFSGRSAAVDKYRYVRILRSYALRLHGWGFNVRSYIDENLPPWHESLEKDLSDLPF